MAVQQDDIKRVLAYSTLSQLGYMVMAVGLLAGEEGMFHLFTHAWFKALLFLGSGAVIHACHHEQDIRHLGGLRRSMPVTFATYAVGMMALSGVPLVFSGFWSKDEILHQAMAWGPSKGPFVLAVVGTVRRTGRKGVSVVAEDVWDLTALLHARREGRLEEALAHEGHATGADVPRKLWHSSGGSAGR